MLFHVQIRLFCLHFGSKINRGYINRCGIGRLGFRSQFFFSDLTSSALWQSVSGKINTFSDEQRACTSITVKNVQLRCTHPKPNNYWKTRRYDRKKAGGFQVRAESPCPRCWIYLIPDVLCGWRIFIFPYRLLPREVARETFWILIFHRLTRVHPASMTFLSFSPPSAHVSRDEFETNDSGNGLSLQSGLKKQRACRIPRRECMVLFMK